MKFCVKILLALPAAALVWACLVGPSARADNDGVAGVRIGMVKTLFRDVPTPVVQALMYPFGGLVREATGMAGTMSVGGEAHDLARDLHDDKVQLGVFHGFEFAWVRQRYPDLKPLCIAINQHRQLYAYVMVKYDSDVKDLSQLKGKVLALPSRSREHCRLFLDRSCAAVGSDPEHFFGKITTPAHVEAALDDIVRGKVQAAVVDGVGLESYEHVKPGCFTALKTIQRSELFPAAVIAYRPGALDTATLTRFRDGMINANKNERTRELMLLWKLTAFEPVPEDFNQSLISVLKAYPPPEVPVGIRAPVTP